MTPSQKELDDDLSRALMRGRVEVARGLIAQGADVLSKRSLGGGPAAYPLERALYAGSVGCAKALLAAGADPFAKSGDMAPLERAGWNKPGMLEAVAAAALCARDRRKAARAVAGALAQALERGDSASAETLSRLREPALEGSAKLAKMARLSAVLGLCKSSLRGLRHKACARAVVETSELDGRGGLMAQREWLGTVEEPSGFEEFRAMVDQAISAREAEQLARAAPEPGMGDRGLRASGRL